MKLSFALYCLILKNGKVGFSENATMIQIQNMFENGKPDIVLKTIKGFNIKRILFIILIPENVGYSFNYRLLLSI